ncbi:MAG: leucine-rich repeat protein, partial [Acutalibacteraceae bacterium]
LTSVMIPSSVTSIVFGTFWECDRLTSVTIPNSIKSIGGHAFWGCSNLTSVTFPDSVTSIGYNAFYGCNNLTSVTIPSSVTEIQYGAFGNCSSLTSVTIPSSVTTIGALVFSHCSNLTSVMIPSSVTSMGSGVFSYCSSLVSISVSDENPNYSSLDGVLFDKEKTEIIAYPAAKACSYDIPSSVTSIGWNAFEGCSSLISVTIPRGVTIIGAYAFSYCSSLAAVTIPSSVTSIGKDAFSYCSSLTSVTIPDSVTSIGPSAFFTSNDITIYGFQGSAAQEYAAEYNILFVELNRLVDTENRISVAETVPGSIPENAQLKIEYLKNTQDEIIYDITLEKDGKPIQPTDGMTVSIPVPQTMNAETCKVFYIDGSGNLTDMNAVYEDGYMTFTTTHFSHYALVQGIDGMLGDLSGNGSLDVDDSLCLFRYVSGQQDLTIKQKVLADVKHDGVLTLSDALLLYRAVSGRATL